MKSLFKQVKLWFSNFYKSIRPGQVAIKGAARAIASTTLVIWLIAASSFFLIDPSTWFGIVPIIVFPPLALLLGGLTYLGIKLLAGIPEALVWVIPGAILILSMVFGQGDLGWQFPLFVLTFAGSLGAAIYTLTKANRSQNTLRQKTVAYLGGLIGLAGLVWGIQWTFQTGFEQDPALNNAALASTYQPEALGLSNPGEPGPYEVKYLSYGSGKDLHRPAFAEDVAFTTDSVDGSRLIGNWKGLAGKLRTWYWGFDDEALPLNGRVWYPEGDGPFPLALIVHGNHSMFDYSDDGYAYLGELLASHGMIMVSVDENFINSGWTDMFPDGLDEENDARGWLLLKHLEEWRKWNVQSDHPFFQKVDMDNIAVMGHSRGGEAAAIAGFFNTLSHYPDDAKEEFNFDFNIRSIVAIAPVDGQYKPGDVGTPLKDINYLVLHGANDGDVQSFAGLRQYERLNYTDSSNYFKSAIYIHGANHGQFNTSWGNRDSPNPWGSLLNVKALMPMEDQLTIGKVLISSFLKATMQNEQGYQELFKDLRSVKEWLPETIYLNQYEDSNWKLITNFDEDLDLTTAGQLADISTEYLTVWKEKLVSMKWGNKDTRAVYVGWDSTAYPQDTAKYMIDFKVPMNIEEHQWLTFEMAHAKENSYPDKERDQEKKDNESNNKEEDDTESEKNEEMNNEQEGEDDEAQEDEKEKAPEPINLSLALYDQNGESVKFDLNEYALLQPQISVDIYKNKSLQTNKTSEAVYQTFFFDLVTLSSLNPKFDVNALQRIAFIFDQEKNGVIILDKLAFHSD